MAETAQVLAGRASTSGTGSSAVGGRRTVGGPISGGVVALVLDTDVVAPEDRHELVRDVLGRSGVPSHFRLNTPARDVHLRMQTWQIGHIPLLRTEGTGLHRSRSERHLRMDAPELIGVGLVTSGEQSVYTAHGATQRLGIDDIHIVDQTGAYEFTHVGPVGGSLVARIYYDELGLPVDTVRAAVPRLAASPLLPLARGHIVDLARCVDQVADRPDIAATLSSATVELVRALIVSAAADHRERDVLHETLRTRIVAYLRRHLREPDLTAARVAAEHHISLRTLYNVWGGQDGSLREWVMGQRLEGARSDLAHPATARTTVAAVAHRWGFSDPAHFSRRFRAAYGLTPSEWRCVNSVGTAEDR
jgi:AraC-like DNA-binding protein